MVCSMAWSPEKNTSHGNVVLPQETILCTTHLIQRPCYQRGSQCQGPAGNRTTQRVERVEVRFRIRFYTNKPAISFHHLSQHRRREVHVLVQFVSFREFIGAEWRLS